MLSAYNLTDKTANIWKGINFGALIIKNTSTDMADNTNTAQNAGAAAQQATKTKRDLALERLKTRHPDTEYADDEAIYGAINDDYDEDQKAIEGYKANEKAVSDMISADPRASNFLQSMRNGKNPFVELVRTFGDDAIDYLSDPDNADEIAKAQEEYLKRVADGKKLDDEYAKNMEESMKVFAQMDEEFGEDTTNELVTKLMGVANDVIVGKFTKETLDLFRLAANHDKDVAEAAHEGEVRGKNSKHMQNLELRKKGDGTPDLSSATDERGGHGSDNMPDFGAISRMASGGNIYERGGEKRIRNR